MTKHQIEELKENQARLALAMDAGDLCSWEIDLTTRHIIHSPNASDIVGFPIPDNLEDILHLVHPEDRERTHSASQGTLENGAPYIVDYRMVNPVTGEARWYHSHGAVKTSLLTGRLIFTGVTQAITGREKEQHSGQQKPAGLPQAGQHQQQPGRAGILTKEKYETLFRSIDEGFCLIGEVNTGQSAGADFQILDSNPAFEKLTGVSHAAGKTISELFPAESAEWSESFDKVFSTGQPVKFEIDLPSTGRQLESFVYLIEDSPRPQAAVLLIDITERRLRERDEDFVAEISHHLTGMQDAEEIMQVTGARLGWHGRYSRCQFIEVQPGGDSVWVNRHWQQHGLPVLQGYFARETFIADNDIEAARSNGWLIAGKSGQSAAPLSKLLDDFGIQSAIFLPFFRDQELSFIVGLTDLQPRVFTEREIKMARTVAARVWTAVERCRFEKALRESETRLQKALSIETVGVLFLNERGKIVQANDTFCRLSGYHSSELNSGRIGWEKITPPEWLEKGRIAMGELNLTGRITPYEKQYIRKDGSMFWALVAASRIDDKETVVYAVDVTDRHEATEALVSSEAGQRNLAARLNLALDAGKLGSYDYHLANGAIYCSAICKRNFGLSERDFLNFDKLVSFILPEYRESMLAAVRDALQQNQEYHAEYKIRKPDGSVTWIRASGKPVYENDIPVRIVGITQDILEEKDLAAVLSKQVAERTLELKRSNEDLLQFAHVASHDLKEPVRKVRIFTSMLKEEIGPAITAPAVAYMEKIQKAGDRMISMIDGVLNYSMQNAAPDRFVAVHLNDIVRQIAQDLELPLQKARGVIRFESLPVFEGTEVLIYQLFYNLIYNAVKFSRKDVPPEITIDAVFEMEGGREWVIITVSDNGIGLENEYGEKIFESFVRLNNKSEYEGTGLGLSLCRKIVTRHKGSITARGEPGKGSVFTVRIPVSQTAG